MTSKDYLKQIAESKGVCPLKNEVKDNALLFPIGFEYIFQDLDRLEELEIENELLKEIIRSFFDRGCPLHQYIDKDFGLAIEVDNECSTMILGEFKGVDLDKKLKEVLEDEL